MNVNPADPNRCQSLKGKTRQCNKRAVPGSEYCEEHNRAMAAREAAQARAAYTLAHWRNKPKKLDIDLKDELALLRGTLEDRLEQCHNSDDLMMSTPVILDIVDRINKLVMNCHKLEYALGEMMDKNRLAQFTDTIINLLVEAELSPEQVSFISDRLTEEMEKTEPVQEK